MLRIEMERCNPSRTPALRRADDDMWLLVSDVPQLLNSESLICLQTSLKHQGCRTEIRNGWLYVDHQLSVLCTNTDVHPDGECACVCSVLQRHNGKESTEAAETETVWKRRIVKTAEQGKVEFERCCALLHKELAERLRQHKPLPTELLPYLRQAWIQIDQIQEEKKK